MTTARGLASVSHLVRLGAILGLSVVTAVAAHAGPAGLAQARWLAVAAAGGVIAMAALLTAALVTAALRRDADRIAAGAPPACRVNGAASRPAFLSLAGTMLVCQVSAHVALLASGVTPGTGAIASPALHVVLAIATAALVWFAEWCLHDAHVALEQAVAAAITRLLSEIDRAARPVLPSDDRRPCPCGGATGGRAPPVAARG